jgi:hypothetical protein
MRIIPGFTDVEMEQQPLYPKLLDISELISTSGGADDIPKAPSYFDPMFQLHAVLQPTFFGIS